MKSKKVIIILSAVVIACAVGFIVSPLVNWSVDSDSTGGDIGKSSRFSRRTSEEGLSNMEELILNDEKYKEGVVVSYVVMQSRAQQFGALVDASNEVAADIPEFASLLKDMNGVRETVDNVCTSLAQAGADLNATLGGEKRPDLAQNTINASLAYVTLQKQNKLADRFIATADNYIKKADADDRLKFVRDQWVTYQQMSAALDGDNKSLKALEDKGYMLSPEEGLATMKAFDSVRQLCFFESIVLSESMNLPSSLGLIIPDVDLGRFFVPSSSQAIQSRAAADPLSNRALTQLEELTRDVLGVQTKDVLGEQTRDVLGAQTKDVLGAQTRDVLGAQTKDVLGESVRMLGARTLVLSSFGEVMQNMNLDLRGAMPSEVINSSLSICEGLGAAIKDLSLGVRPHPVL
jgi:hypothetical protein